MKTNDPKILKTFLENLSKRYPLKDHFEKKKKETKLSDIFSRKAIPKELDNYGVYLIIDKKDEIVYIGKSGTLKQDGTFGNHSLGRRIMQGTKKQTWLKGGKYKVYWFVTIEKTNRNSIKPEDIPSVVECELLKTFYELTGYLPKKNNAF